MKLEIVQPSTSAKSKYATRSDTFGNIYHSSRKYFTFNNTAGALHSWWDHAKNVVQMILDHHEFKSKIASTKAAEKNAASFRTLMNNGADMDVAKSPSKENGGKKLTLEERVRARALLNPANIKAKQTSNQKAESSQITESKLLLELADALRAYSQRRGLASSSAGSSALERLKERATTGAVGGTQHGAKNIARLTVMDLIKDARLSWNTVVNQSIHKSNTSGGTKSRGGSAIPTVSIDLSRLLFQMRLTLVSSSDVPDKRQMELKLLDLLEKLAATVPKWVQLRRASLTVASSGTKNAKLSNQKLNIKQSTIIIQNDSVDYITEVRAKLGGRVQIPTSAQKAKSNGGIKPGSLAGAKRQREQEKGPISAADAIVPPSFQRIYGKALEERKKVDKK